MMMLAFTPALDTSVKERRVAAGSISLVALAAIIVNIAVILQSTF